MGSDGMNDSFDATTSRLGTLTGEVKEAAAKPDIASPRAVPAAPVNDDARDFFDGKKG